MTKLKTVLFFLNLKQYFGGKTLNSTLVVKLETVLWWLNLKQFFGGKDYTTFGGFT